MLSFVYNVCLLLVTLTLLPKWLWKKILKKKYRFGLLHRLGFYLPKINHSKRPVIWIHMVSVGETKAMIGIYAQLKKTYPNAAFFLSSITETGHEEAKRSLPNAEEYFLLPLDISFIMKRLVRRIQPKLLILSESDFWFHLCKYVKKAGGNVFLINGKISPKSTHRFSLIPWFTKSLFDQLDLLCVQNSHYVESFQKLQISPTKIKITGNLKLDVPILMLSSEERKQWQHRMGIKEQNLVITIGSTHEGEEKLLLRSLDPLFKKFPNLKILLAPRHPERFSDVYKWVSDQNYKVERHSQNVSSDAQIILVDEMGILCTCYAISHLAIVGGSFIPGMRGHNILEPIQVGIPVLFGPYMHSQKDLVEIVLQGKAGKQVAIQNLEIEIMKILQDLSTMHKYAFHMTEQMHGVLDRTWNEMKNYLELQPLGIDS